MHASRRFLFIVFLSLPFRLAYGADPCKKDQVTPDATAACAEKRLSVDKQAVGIEYQKLLSQLPQKQDEQSEISPTATKAWFIDAQTDLFSLVIASRSLPLRFSEILPSVAIAGK